MGLGWSKPVGPPVVETPLPKQSISLARPPPAIKKSPSSSWNLFAGFNSSSLKAEKPEGETLSTKEPELLQYRGAKVLKKGKAFLYSLGSYLKNSPFYICGKIRDLVTYMGSFFSKKGGH